MDRSPFYASDAFVRAAEGLGMTLVHASPFAASGVYTHVRDGKLTLAGLRGSRPAQLIERLGLRNQVADGPGFHALRQGAMFHGHPIGYRGVTHAATRGNGRIGSPVGLADASKAGTSDGRPGRTMTVPSLDRIH